MRFRDKGDLPKVLDLLDKGARPGNKIFNELGTHDLERFRISSKGHFYPEICGS